jgi:hypothetical protein
MGGWARRGTRENLIGKPEGKRPFGKSRRRWEGNIKMYLNETGCEVVDRIRLRIRSMASSCVNNNVPRRFIKGREFF